jgi:hypothetical protein
MGDGYDCNLQVIRKKYTFRDEKTRPYKCIFYILFQIGLESDLR